MLGLTIIYISFLGIYQHVKIQLIP